MARSRWVNGIVALVLLVLLLPVLLPWFLLGFIHSALLYVLIWLCWLPRGKDVLFVYSDSPIWKEYMLTEVLPLVQDRAVVLNWSERAQWRWWRLGVRAFRALSGYREYNPMVIVFRPFRLAKEFRFWPAFRSWKHGDKAAVEGLRQDLLNELRPKAL